MTVEPEIVFTPQYGWVEESAGFSGGNAPELGLILSPLKETNLELCSDALRSHNAHFGVMVRGESGSLAAVDRIRSYPIFYLLEGEKLVAVGNNARSLLERVDDPTVDILNLKQLAATGYVLGSGTVYRELRQLQPGEAIWWSKDEHKLIRYYTYCPVEPDQPKTREDYISELGELIDEIFQDIVEQANGRMIVMPLSGGLDSRLILAKLHELKYPNLFTFTYGPDGNGQQKRAKVVVEELGVPWQYMPIDRERAQTYVKSDERREMCDLLDGLSVIPGAFAEHDYLKQLRDSGLIDADSIIINGQSGDYISGGHIPKVLFEDNATVDDLLDYTMEKHFGLFPEFRRSEKRFFRESIIENLYSRDPKIQGNELIALYEGFEWQERQSKFVVNYNRLYSFLNFDWFLPLWSPSLMDFFEKLPVEYRRGQGLYKEYLQQWDYRGLFSRSYPGEPVYVGPKGQILFFAQRVLNRLHLPFDQVYRVNNYFYGHYSFQFQYFNYSQYSKDLPFPIKPRDSFPAARRCVSLFTKKWLRENNLDHHLSL